jgi:transcriptional regulator NrdR family protein
VPKESVKHCPKCGSITLVRDSRLRTARGVKMQRLARRRICPKCGYVYSTVEMPESEYKQLMNLKEMVRNLQGDKHDTISSKVEISIPGSS